MNQVAPAKLNANDLCWCGSGRKYLRCHRDNDRTGRRGGISASTPKFRPVPASIPAPDYAISGEPRQRKLALIKSPEQIDRMRTASRIAAEVLQIVGLAIRPGMTTDELDAIGHDAFIERGAYPSTLNYNGYPKSLCASLNDVICHGIPGAAVLHDGDILNIDVTAYHGGVHGDCNATFYVGAVDEASRRLVECARDSMLAGIDAVAPGRLLNGVGKAIEDIATARGFSVVRAFVGHGIGEMFHMEPQVPHYYDPRLNFRIQAGMTFTVEPMINAGGWRHRMDADGWTARTADGRRSAQFEHTILVTETGAEILTIC